MTSHEILNATHRDNHKQDNPFLRSRNLRGLIPRNHYILSYNEASTNEQVCASSILIKLILLKFIRHMNDLLTWEKISQRLTISYAAQNLLNCVLEEFSRWSDVLFSFLKFTASFTVSDHLPFPQLHVFFREVAIGSQTMTTLQRFIAKN